jgi:DNA-binding response OmpR family regulator
MPRLLLIEDNQHIQRVYREKFQHEGFEVAVASDGEQGLASVRETQPDIILLDIMLPKLSGFDVLKQLRDDTTLNRIPVFMLSNKSWPNDVHHALSLGARQFYAKGSSSLQEIITQIRADCGFKKVIIISGSADAAKSIAVAIRHPQLLCSTVTVLAETNAVVQRGAPDLVLLDSRPPANNAITILQQLKTAPATHSVPVIAITDQPQSLARADAAVNSAKIETELRPVVVKLLGLSRSVPVLATPAS